MLTSKSFFRELELTVRSLRDLFFGHVPTHTKGRGRQCVSRDRRSRASGDRTRAAPSLGGRLMSVLRDSGERENRNRGVERVGAHPTSAQKKKTSESPLSTMGDPTGISRLSSRWNPRWAWSSASKSSRCCDTSATSSRHADPRGRRARAPTSHSRPLRPARTQTSSSTTSRPCARTSYSCAARGSKTRTSSTIPTPRAPRSSPSSSSAASKHLPSRQGSYDKGTGENASVS